jgi:hypothetical protein
LSGYLWCVQCASETLDISIYTHTPMCASETLDISPKPSSTLKLRGCNSYLRSQLQRSLNDALSTSIEDVVGSSLYRVSLFFLSLFIYWNDRFSKSKICTIYLRVYMTNTYIQNLKANYVSNIYTFTGIENIVGRKERRYRGQKSFIGDSKGWI